MKTLSSFRIWSIVVLAALLPGLAAPGQSASAQSEEFPQENAWTRVTPSVVWCNDPDTPVTVEVHIVGRQDVARVWVDNLSNSREEADNELFDDGTHGDGTAGDNAFTRGGVILPCYLDNFKGRGWANWWGFLRVELKNGTRMENNYGLIAGLVDPQFKKAFGVQDLGNGLSATAYAFFIVDSKHEVMDNYPVANVTCGTSNFNAYKKFYSVMPDDFDFALLMPGMQIFRPKDLAENVPYDVRVSNNVKNIGVEIFDDTARFGSAGHLKAVTYHSFGDIAIVDHELAHAWGMHLGADVGLMETWQGSPYLGHWNALSDVQGQMGSYYHDDSGHVGHFAYNGDGTWRLIANTEVEPYSPLELYAMGMLPPEQVPPIHILTGPSFSDPTRITAASYETVTIDQIMQAEGGPRLPSAAEAQKDFTMAFLVTQDSPFNDAAYAYFSLMSHELMSKGPPREYSYFAPFFWATGGRGTLTTDLPVNVSVPTWLPGMPTPTPEPTATSPVVATEIPATAQTGVQPTPTPGKSPICGSTFVAGGLVLIPGFWLILRKRRGG